MSLTISVSAKFSETDAGTEKGQFGFGYVNQIIMKVEVYFKQEIQTINLL